jgi:hypothetical protein
VYFSKAQVAEAAMHCDLRMAQRATEFCTPWSTGSRGKTTSTLISKEIRVCIDIQKEMHQSSRNELRKTRKFTFFGHVPPHDPTSLKAFNVARVGLMDQQSSKMRLLNTQCSNKNGKVPCVLWYSSRGPHRAMAQNSSKQRKVCFTLLVFSRAVVVFFSIFSLISHYFAGRFRAYRGNTRILQLS